MSGLSAKLAVERCERLADLGPVPPWWRVLARRRWLRAFAAIMAADISTMGEMLREMYPRETVDALVQRQHRLIVGPFVEVVERVQIGKDGKPDESTRSLEVRE